MKKLLSKVALVVGMENMIRLNLHNMIVASMIIVKVFMTLVARLGLTINTFVLKMLHIKPLTAVVVASIRNQKVSFMILIFFISNILISYLSVIR